MVVVHTVGHWVMPLLVLRRFAPLRWRSDTLWVKWPSQERRDIRKCYLRRDVALVPCRLLQQMLNEQIIGRNFDVFFQLYAALFQLAFYCKAWRPNLT